jgi:hypothetical protein
VRFFRRTSDFLVFSIGGGAGAVAGEEERGDARPGAPALAFYQALGRNPLRDSVPWRGWGVLVAVTVVLVVVAAVGLQRRDVRQ